MENWVPYFHRQKSKEELIKNAMVVVDTNVLLSAYQWREVTVNEMLKTLQELSSKGRLRIPLQVIKEFFKNRPNQIIQRINEIEGIISGLQNQRPLNQIAPILEGRGNYIEALKHQTELNDIQKVYRESLIKLRDELKNLFDNDFYLDDLKRIVQNSYIETSVNEEELIRVAEKRFKSKIPPGYKDDPKAENSAGDFIIWHTMIELNTDVIFVSGDKKADWLYTDKHKNPIGVRSELLQEFFEKTEGKDFLHLTPREFITLLNPEVSEEVKEDLLHINTNKEDDFEKNVMSTHHYIYKTLRNINPYDLEDNLNTERFYKAKANEIAKNINKVSSLSEMVDLALDIIPLKHVEDYEKYHNMVRALFYELVDI